MNKGQSLFEVVVAIAISALVIIAIVSLASNSIRNAAFSRNKNQAASLAQQLTEWLRIQRDTNIDTFITNVTPSPKTYCFSDLTWSRARLCGASDFVIGTSLFARQGVFTLTTSPQGKTVIEADITVSWTDSQGYHEVRSATNFTDWRQR